MSNKTPTFSGKYNENVEDWLFIVEHNLRKARIPETAKLGEIIEYVRGTPLSILREHLQNGKTSWEDFRKTLIKTFKPVNFELETLNQLRELKQRDFKFIGQYVNKFLNLTTKIKLTEKEKFNYFLGGLSSSFVYEIKMRQASNMDEAVAIAMQFEKVKQSKPENKGRWSSNFSNKSVHDQLNGANPMRKQILPNDNKTNKQKLTCFKCGKEGHIATKCTTPKSKTQHKVNVARFGNEILTVNGTIEEKDIKFGLDSGATCSILSEKIAKGLKSKIKPTEIQVKTASSQSVSVVGITEPTPVNVYGHTTELEFIVLRDVDYEALLGLDWFENAKAGIFPDQKLLKFREDSVYLNNDEIVENIEVDYNVLLAEVLEEDSALEQDNEWPVLKEETSSKGVLNELEPNFMCLKETILSVTANDVSELGECTVEEFRITLVDDKPIHIPPYRMSEAERRDARKEIDTLLEAGVIRQSRSPYSFPIIMVAKKDGTRRLCIDYRKLNAVTISESWPIRNIQDIFDRLSGSKIFTTLDLKSGYWQVRMHEDSIAKTAFSTPDGHYEFTRLPFGLKNAPAEFSRIMFIVLGDLPFIEIYIDDIIIHSEDMERHVKHVAEVLNRIEMANLVEYSKMRLGKK
jgi:hypothetical protein